MRPIRLLEAMRYAVLSPSPRLQPFLLVESARIFGREDEGVLRAAAALECVHAYSVVREGLPGENDAATNLAGDALLALAFDILADPAVDPDPLTCAALIGALARAIGVGGMLGGRIFECEGEERVLTEAELLQLQTMKTGVLFRHAVQAGALLGRASEADRHRLIAFGEKFGLAHRLACELAKGSENADSASEGVATSWSRQTLVAFYGIEKSRTLLAVTSAEAAATLEPFGVGGEMLAEAARYVAIRKT